MKKSILAVLGIILFATVLSACNNKAKEVDTIESVKPVKTITVVEKQNPVFLEYTGIVFSEEVRKLSFKSPGKIKSIPVKKGQKVQKGEVLAYLDTTDLEFALKASKAQMESAQEQYNKVLNGAEPEDINNAQINVKKAQEAFDFAKSNYDKAKVLFDNAGITENDLNKVQLEMNIRKLELDQAKEVLKKLKKGASDEDKKTLLYKLEQAKVDYQQKQSMVDAAVIKSDIDGFVAEILLKESEFCSAGYPVVVVRNNNQVVRTGVSLKDKHRLKIGMKAQVSFDNMQKEGVVSQIDDIPDELSRTYTAEITLTGSEYSIGSIANVKFILDNRVETWIPISSILTRGEDFVFVVNGDTVEKRKVEIIDAKGSEIMVNGLKAGEAIVIEGMKN
ncbi:MAG: efflux RND transporter periplasmic adaptor subunit, partial [Bacillota bacterium]